MLSEIGSMLLANREPSTGLADRAGIPKNSPMPMTTDTKLSRRAGRRQEMARCREWELVFLNLKYSDAIVMPWLCPWLPQQEPANVAPEVACRIGIHHLLTLG